MNLLCAYVGPVQLADYAKTRFHPRLETGLETTGGPIVVGGPPAEEADRVL
jgi:hypothetical protein